MAFKLSKQNKALIKALPTLNNLRRQAKKEAYKVRFIEAAREMNFWEKLELHFKIGL